MASESATVQKEARHGEKMIGIRHRFWTNDVAKHGKIVPKHAWTAGVVLIESSKTHD